jgi:hypothetical protein
MRPSQLILDISEFSKSDNKSLKQVLKTKTNRGHDIVWFGGIGTDLKQSFKSYLH